MSWRHRKGKHICQAIKSCRNPPVYGSPNCELHSVGGYFKRKAAQLEKLLKKRGVTITMIEESSEFISWHWTTTISRGKVRLYKPLRAQ